jgi:hypothetical protein
MAGETFEIIRPKPVSISELNAIGPALRELAEECVQMSDEIAAMLVIDGPKAGELKDQEAYLETDRFAGTQEGLLEKLGVEKILIELTSRLTEPVQIREALKSYGIGNLESEKKIGRHLVGHILEIGLAGESVVGGIDTDGWENFRVFSEAITVESAFSELAPPLITSAVIKEAGPSGVLP